MPAWFRSHTFAQMLVLGTTVAVPLFVLPDAQAPFATPRLILLALATLIAAAATVTARPAGPLVSSRIAPLVAAWLLAIGLSAAVAPYVSAYAIVVWTLPIAWAAVVLRARPAAHDLAGALATAACLASLCVLLQWAGWDPIRAAGWQPVAYGRRMRAYGTLGNPDFVGAYLASLLPLALAWRPAAGRRPYAAAAAPVAIAAGIVATGSRAAWLGSVAGLVVLGVARRGTGGRRLATAALLALVTVGVLLAPTRTLRDTIGGRLYIWTTAAPHALDHPATGSGPGSFAVLYPAWEAQRIRRGVDADVRRYAAAQRHAHNDYLELLVDLGVPGLAAFVLLMGAAIGSGLRGRAGSGQDLRAAAAAGIAAFGAIALVDFPFQRPVESVTWWTLLALVALADDAPAERSRA